MTNCRGDVRATRPTVTTNRPRTIPMTLPFDDADDDFDAPQAPAPPAERERADRAGDHLSMLLARFAKSRDMGSVKRRAEFDGPRGEKFRPDVAYWAGGNLGVFRVPAASAGDAPTLVAEVSGSSAYADDANERFRSYVALGVWELVLVDADTRSAQTWIRSDRRALQRGGRSATGRLVPHGTFDARDDLRLYSLPGFAVPMKAIFDPAANLTALVGWKG